MIVDTIKNCDIYSNLSDRILKGLEILKEPDISTREDGKYEVFSDNLFYTVQRYKTKDASEGKFEAHKKYIDIQAVLKGKEIIGYANINSLKESTPYKEDIVFFETPEDYSKVKMQENMFIILFPGDAHMPLCDYNGKNDVLKIVIKVKI